MHSKEHATWVTDGTHFCKDLPGVVAKNGTVC
jgi:hypothetical protein